MSEREAVRLAPNNIPLRQALADALLSQGRAPEAEAEYRAGKVGWGHSTYPMAIALAEDAGIPRVLLTHHDPTRTDDALDVIYASGYIQDEVAMLSTGVNVHPDRETAKDTARNVVYVWMETIMGLYQDLAKRSPAPLTELLLRWTPEGWQRLR